MALTAPFLALLAKLLSGANVRWVDSQPDPCQRVYFANHTSHLDALVLWSCLPREVRSVTRAVAARDYWEGGPVRRHIARSFNVLLIDRENIKVHQSPVERMIREIGNRYSLIVFPEGGRNTGEEMGEFKSGLYYLAKKRPELELVPVYMENLNRVLAAGRGVAGAVAELHHLWAADVAGSRRTQDRLSGSSARAVGRLKDL